MAADTAEDVVLGLAPDMEGEWAMDLDGKLKHLFY